VSVEPVAATIAGIREATPTVRVFTLVPSEALVYRAGQWLDLLVDRDGELLVGGYSLTSSPLVQGSVEIAVKRAREHAATRYLHERAAVGERVLIAGGQGQCTFEAGMAPALVLLAGGIGITPLMSIVRYAREAAPEVAITLLHSAGVADELLFREELTALAEASGGRLRCRFLVSRGSGPLPAGVERGRIDRDRLGAFAIDRDAVCYVCGPPGMIDDLERALLTLGVERGRIRYERWW